MGLLVLDEGMNIEGWNPFLSDRSDVFEPSLRGRSFLEAFPEARTAVWQKMNDDIAQGSEFAFAQWQDNPFLIALPASPSNPEQLMLQSVSLTPFTDAGGKRHFTLLITDVSRLKRFDNQVEQALAGLSSKHRELGKLKIDLEKANNQLLQSEKLASIGQLAAGVAHEINNPIGYVFSNLRTLAGYVEDMMSIIDVIDSTDSLESLRQVKKQLEYEYIRDDIRSLISESEDGIDRVKRIISAMKDFSHIGEDSFNLTDLHRGIETTLNVVNNEIKYKAEVVREYGELPEVECIASQINQVVMNLLVNASHAIADFGRIALRTGVEGEEVWLEVEDSGSGMDEATIKRIFDPFFTTKPVGTGTGLGLALSYNIIKKHNGRIDVDSTPGQGTRFRIWLPIRQPQLEVPLAEGGHD
ncbi:MAG: ATP-binding protein [Pseudomonas sp.]